ncbi:unnamed protein product [Calypogeia fissa]
MEATKGVPPTEMEVFASVEMFGHANQLFFEEFFSGYGVGTMGVGDEDNVVDTNDSARVVLGDDNALSDDSTVVHNEIPIHMDDGGTARPVSQLQDVALACDTSAGELDPNSTVLPIDMDGGTTRPVSHLQDKGVAGDTSVRELDPHSVVDIEDMDDGGTTDPVSQLQDIALAIDTSAGQLVVDSADHPVDMDIGGTASPVSKLDDVSFAHDTTIHELDSERVVQTVDLGYDGGTASPISQLDDVAVGYESALGSIHIGNVSPIPLVCKVDVMEETTGAGLDIVLAISEIDVPTIHFGVSEIHEVVVFNPTTSVALVDTTNIPRDTTNVHMELDNFKMTDLVQGVIA